MDETSHPRPPEHTPDPVTLAEIELAVLGVAPLDVTVVVGAEAGDKATAAGLLAITDPEGAPVTTATVRATTNTGGPDPDRAVRLHTEITPTDQAAPSSGPFNSLRRGPAEAIAGSAEPSAIISHDPPDAHSLAATDPSRPLLLIVLDGPRSVPGPDVAGCIRAALAIRDDVRADGRVAEVVVVPAPQYGDERDEATADRIAAAYGAHRVLTTNAPTPGALQTWLDGQTEAPHADWPSPSLAAWREWRPEPSTRGLVLFFTGLSGSGKSTVARAVVDRIRETSRRPITLLDGDVVRRNLSAGLGFSRADRDRNIERIGFVAAEIARHGGLAVCAPIAPFAATRARVRASVEAYGDLVLVHVATPLEECERRDRKGLYARARAGEITEFTGISSPYEAPTDADVVLDTSRLTIDQARDVVLGHLADRGRLPEAFRAEPGTM